VILCSFSTPVSELKPSQRTAENVLCSLQVNPLISCFDLSEHAWLRNLICELERSGRIRDDRKEPYPWVRYTVISERHAREDS
jgi:hypothetical protein